MSQTQDLFNIELVQDVDQESAATISGGLLNLSSRFNGQGARRSLSGADRNFANAPGVRNFNNVASWYEVTGNRNWIAYTGFNYTGRRYLLRAGRRGNLGGGANNTISSARPA